MIHQTRKLARHQSQLSPADWPGVFVELRPAPEPCDVFRRMCHLPHCIFFDSATADPHVGRYSFIAADPFELLTATVEDESVWDRIQRQLEQFAVPALPDLPPFQGGAAGMFSYDLAHSLERLPWPRFDEFKVPGLVLGLYDVVVAFDHQTQQAWLISQGFPEQDPLLRSCRARERARKIRDLLDARTLSSDSRPCSVISRRIPSEQFAPQHPIEKRGSLGCLTSNFSRAGYLSMAERAIDYILAGDVFQVNLAQRLLYPARDDSVSLYLRLRKRNSAPFAAYFDLGGFQIVSASPERFLQVRDRQVEARPIKGTRPRTADRAGDDQTAGDLLASQKDRAENIMIVDLLRNDLSRVSQPHSVVVSELCRLERYAFVQHLVSVVQGTLKDDLNSIDLLRASFPGGSVTGAPKVRAMEIIAELEPTSRGAYCGALGYIGFDGTTDTSILIRTVTAGRGWWQFPVGGGIVAQSDPVREYEETWAKAEGLLRALNP